MEHTEAQLISSIKTKVTAHSLDIGSHTIRYVKAGKGPALFLLHGGNIGWGQWYPNIAELAKKYTVYACDTPGSGRSSRVNYDALDLEKDFVDTVDGLIKKLKLKKVTLVGSSIGGWIALKLALRNKKYIDKLVLIDAVGFMNHVQPFDRIIGLSPLAKLLSKTVLKPTKNNANIERFLRSVFYNQDTNIAPEFISYFYETMRTSHNLLLISRLSSVWGMRKELVLQDQLKKVKNETLVLWGENDALMPVKYNIPYAEMLENGKIELISSAGHIPSIEKASIVNKHLMAFV